MTPLLIIKTANGFALMPYSGEIPQADLRELTVASSLKSAYSYGHDGLLSLVEAHFTPQPEPSEVAA